MFERLGVLVYRRRGVVLGVWLVVFVAGVVVSGGTMSRLRSDMEGATGSQSMQVQARLQELGQSASQVVAIVDDVDVRDQATREQVQAAARDVARIEHVERVMDAYSTGAPELSSPDFRATLVIAVVDPGLGHAEVKQTGAAIAERLRRIEVGTVRVGGGLLLEEEWQVAIERDLHREIVALPVALVAMVMIFGGLLAASLPLFIALFAVVAAVIVLAVVSVVTDLSVFTINVVTMLGLGLGIDYGLLMVSRFREERADGRTLADAVARTVATAGTTVAFSGLTVAMSLVGLFAFGDLPVFRSFGIAGIGVTVAAMASGVTLLPALLGMFGHRIKPAKQRVTDDGYFYRVSRFIQGRAVPVVVIVGVGLAVLALPFRSAEFGVGDVRTLPRGSEIRTTAEAIDARFPSRGAEPIIVIGGVPAGAIQQIDGVVAVSAHPGTDILEVVPEGTTQGAAAQRIVRELRQLDADILVGGAAAYLVDFKESVRKGLPVALTVIGVATFALLFLMTGSIAVPIKAIVMNLLSLGASFGALVWVFQDGHLSGLLGFDPVGSLDVFMPVLIFIFAFGLSMDYEVFLLSRVKEIYDQTHDSDEAVALGLQRTGRIITSAAFLMVIVFAGFATGDVLAIKQLGFGLGLAVIVDATIVRSILVPATMRLLGDRNWWAPRPLGALHERFGLREADGAAAPVPVWESRGFAPEASKPVAYAAAHRGSEGR